MRHALSMIALLILFVVTPATVLPQTLHVVVVLAHTFSPSDLTIVVGDTIRWENQSGFHNVVADNGSFTNGVPSSSLWTYDYVFTTVGEFKYYCVIHGGPGLVGMSGIIRVTNLASVGTNNAAQPDRFIVEQNYPNPFNPSTKIRYDLPQKSLVTVTVFNILGKEIATLVNGEQASGRHEINFTTENLPSGVYLYRVQAGKYVQTKKMSLLK
jgi:plastocyanin